MAVPNVEPWAAPPATELRLFRLAGAFPAFAPDGRRLALTGGSFAQLDVMNVDGSGAGRSTRACSGVSSAPRGRTMAIGSPSR